MAAAFCASSFSSRTCAASASAARMPAVSAPRAASRLTARARFASTARDPSHAATSTTHGAEQGERTLHRRRLFPADPRRSTSTGKSLPDCCASPACSRERLRPVRGARYGAAISFCASGTSCPPDGIFTQPAVCSVRAYISPVGAAHRPTAPLAASARPISIQPTLLLPSRCSRRAAATVDLAAAGSSPLPRSSVGNDAPERRRASSWPSDRACRASWRARSRRWRAIRGRPGTNSFCLPPDGQLDPIEVGELEGVQAAIDQVAGVLQLAQHAARHQVDAPVAGVAQERLARRSASPAARCRSGGPSPLTVTSSLRFGSSRPSSLSLAASSTPNARGDTQRRELLVELLGVVGARQIARGRRRRGRRRRLGGPSSDRPWGPASPRASAW